MPEVTREHIAIYHEWRKYSSEDLSIESTFGPVGEANFRSIVISAPILPMLKGAFIVEKVIAKKNVQVHPITSTPLS